MSGPANRAAEIPAPPLREDLRLHHGTQAGDERGHLVYDPVAHRYHELDEQAFAILGHWRAGMPFEALSKHLSVELKTVITTDELIELAVGFDQAGLFSEPLHGWRAIYGEQQSRRHGPFAWLLHNYLFIRIPLVRPDAFLKRTLPLVRRLASPIVVKSICLIGLVGLYLTSRQWDAFTNTFLFFFSIEGAAGYMAALVFVKIFHELGHAYMARHFGCRVPTMGMAFLVLAPVLYTDVTDSWRLPSRRQKLLVAAAGMMAELAIAAIALFLWALLPDGTLRSACFFVATTSLVLSLAINLSPLMRFDGYYLLSDFWRIPNLQSRAFAVMRWSLREVLFGLGAPCPEDWPRRRRLAVVTYAVITCIYRLGLFIGIALLVYHMTFKILGILLFAVEILWFVARPIGSELMTWWRLRPQILERRRYRLTLAAFMALMVLTVIPWPQRVEIPAVLEPVALQRLVVPVAAQIKAVAVKAGDSVSPGDLLFELEAPKLTAEITATQTKLDLARLRRDRRTADQADRNLTIPLEQEIASLTEKLAGLGRLADELDIRANTAGVVRDLQPDLHIDRWLARGEELGLVVAEKGYQVRGYLSEELVASVTSGATGSFISDEPLARRLAVRLEAKAASSAAAIDLPYLSSTYGGQVAVTEDKDKGGIPVVAEYQIVMSVAAKLSPSQPVLRGTALVDGHPDSLLYRFVKRASAILIRESGF